MTRTVLLVSSGGGHAVQARLLKPAFEGHRIVHFVAGVDVAGFRDCSMSSLWRAPGCFWAARRLILDLEPDIVISTGALPGLLAVLAARLQRRRAVWIDSVANARTLSLSGKVARWIAHKTYSQWPEVARAEAVSYAGAVL